MLLTNFIWMTKESLTLDLKLVGGKPTNFNYKVKIKVEDDSFVIAELDSDSHISLMSESYFNRLSELTKIKYLPEAPVTFSGMGSTVTSPYSPMSCKYSWGGSG